MTKNRTTTRNHMYCQWLTQIIRLNSSSSLLVFTIQEAIFTFGVSIVTFACLNSITSVMIKCIQNFKYFMYSVMINIKMTLRDKIKKQWNEEHRCRQTEILTHQSHKPMKLNQICNNNWNEMEICKFKKTS